MESIQTLLEQNPNLIDQGVGIVDEKLYNTCFYIARKLSPNRTLTEEEINLVSTLILEKCLAQYKKESDRQAMSSSRNRKMS